MAFQRIYIWLFVYIVVWSLRSWAVYGQTWTPSSLRCPCVCTYASGPQLTLALGPGSFKQVDCSYRNLYTIPNNLPSDTEVLILGNNNIKKISNLQGVTRLKYLDLSHNYISKILDGTFENNPNLQYLSLSWNELQVVSEGAFQTLGQLSRLLLSGNQLGYIPSAVKALSSLVAIDLTNNRIIKVLSNSFENLGRLQFINLRSNLIQNIQPVAFSHLPSLVNLQLSQNNINLLRPDAFLNVSRLSTLSLGYNSFKNLPSNQFVNIPSLEVIHLEGNQITRLPGSIFQSLPNLLEVNLKDNGLEILPSNIFQGRQNLQKIHLAGNEPTPPISSEMFNGLPNLISLSVSQLPMPLDSLPEQLLELTITDSSLSYIPPNFLHNLPSLETLVLSENMISDIAEGAFHGLNLLRNLDLSGNYLTSIPGWMFAANFTALEKIFLQENRIERIFPEAFAGLTSLRSLTLESNLIKELPSDVFPPSLEYLQLGENPIKYLDVNVVSELTALRLFSADSRNFQCDCLLQHFVDWLGINNVIVDGASDLRCNTPSRLRGVGLLQLNHRQLYCGPPSILTAPKAQEVTVRMGFNVTLPCSLLPHSVATLKWDTAKQNSLTMSSFYRTAYAINNYQLLPTGTLLVLNVSPLDGGNYTCTAANPAGTDIITYFVAVYQEKETTPQPPIQTTIITPINNTTAIVANRPTNLPQNTIKPTISNLNPVTQVIVNVTTVPPGAPPVPTNVTLGSTANNRIPVKITTIKPPTDSNVTLSSTANNIIPVKITTIKPTTNSVINLPTESPRTAVTNATLVDRQPSPNGTEQAPGTKSNTTHVEKLPQTGQGTNETDTRGKNGGHGQNNGIGQTTNLPSIVDGLATKSSTTTLQTGLGSLPTKDPTKPIDPCNPNPCLHRGTCQVLSQKPQDPEEDSSQFDSYSESMSNGNDLGDEIDVERGKQSAQCTCRKKFGGPTCKIRKPEVPYQVTVLETHSNVITLEWAQKNVGNVDGYRIYYSLVGDRDMTKSMPIHRNVQSFTMEELKEESTYRICVVAFNDGGDTPVGDENCIWADTKSGPKNIMALVKTEYGIIGGGILFVIMLTMLTAICYSKGKKERDYERSVVIPRVSQSVADLPPSNVFRRNLKPRESAFYQDDMMLLDLSRQSERKKYMNPFDSRHSIMMPDTEHINPPLGFGEGIPASLMPNNARRTLRIQEDMV